MVILPLTKGSYNIKKFMTKNITSIFMPKLTSWLATPDAFNL